MNNKLVKIKCGTNSRIIDVQVFGSSSSSSRITVVQSVTNDGGGVLAEIFLGKVGLLWYETLALVIVFGKLVRTEG